MSFSPQKFHKKNAKSLLIAGIVHRNPEAAGKTRRLLKNLEPDAILYEISPYSLRFRKRFGCRIKSEILDAAGDIEKEKGSLFPSFQKEFISDFFMVPEDYLEIERYAESRGIAVICMDISCFSKRYLREQLMDLRDRDILAETIRNAPASEEALIEECGRIYSKGSKARAPAHSSDETRARDVFMLLRLMRFLRKTACEEILLLCGADHLPFFRSVENLINTMNYKSAILTLDEACNNIKTLKQRRRGRDDKE
ncbi:MAG: hypothetical protein FJ088_00585 [Deltaproteobacteria bacterium]|nr:hypothetical protein [Deltaproteobacteria bacterium]